VSNYVGFIFLSFSLTLAQHIKALQYFVISIQLVPQ